MVKKLLCVMLAAAMLFSVTGCKKEGGSGEGNLNFNELGNTVSDSSEIPTWEGKQLKLKVWYGASSGGWQTSQPIDDVVSKELTRITGVTLDADESFENTTTGLADAELGKIAASGDWPDLVLDAPTTTAQTLIEMGKAWEVKDLYQKSCTNLMKLWNDQPKLKVGIEGRRDDGNMYEFFYSPMTAAIKFTNPEIPKERMNLVSGQPDMYPFVYVRDDILKKVYPEAKTKAELDEIFLKNGKFTEEEIMDVTFEGREDFYNFLYKVRDMNIVENGKQIKPFYTAYGSDNWNLFVMMGGLYGYNYGGESGANYFTYWDRETDKVEYMFKQPQFKDQMWDFTKLVIDGVADKEAFIDTYNDFTQKTNSGFYAVLYGWNPPESFFDGEGKDYNYRKVYIKEPQQTEKYLFGEYQLMGQQAMLLNENLSEEDVEQVLRYFDFLASDAGQKLVYWGPKTAGLFEEAEDGTRRYLDKDLEDAMVYDVQNGKNKEYNLGSTSWPNYPLYKTNKYNPKFIYKDLVVDETGTNKAFSISNITVPELIVTEMPNIWLFDNYGVAGIQEFWKSRTSFEEKMLKVMASTTREDFDKRFDEMVADAERLGMTDETLAQANEKFAEINAENMANIK